ncbi:MAG: hypothetical protein AAFW98_12895 [Pseudomonadota bacterium]
MGFIRVALAAISLAAAAPSAAASPMTAEEIRDTILGKRLIGIREDTNERWFECIAESADTVFNIEGRVSTGFVEVHEGGLTCFTYPRPDHTSHACFTVTLENGLPVFTGMTGTRFRVDAIDESFEECPKSAPTS